MISAVQNVTVLEKPLPSIYRYLLIPKLNLTREIKIKYLRDVPLNSIGGA